MNTYMLSMASIAANIVGVVSAKWIYAQWAHETNGFTSDLCVNYYNLGGLTQITNNGLWQPDGDCFYMRFNSYEAFAIYFGRYLRLYESNGIFDCQSIEDYVRVLKDGGYFGDDYQSYLDGCKLWLASIR